MELHRSESPFLSTGETAKMMGLSIKTLQEWRSKRRGPTYFKLGRAVRYQLADVLAYLEQNKVSMEG